MVLSSSHVWIWKSQKKKKKGWVPRNWCLWTVVLGKTLESPLDCKEMKPVNPKVNQPWIFIGRTDAETPYYDVKSRHWKRLWYWERLKQQKKETAEVGMVGYGLPTQWTWVWANPGISWRAGKPGRLQSMGCKESDTTEQLNNNVIASSVNICRHTHRSDEYRTICHIGR